MADLLFEIGAEEIPAGYIAPALAQLASALTAGLESARLAHGAVATLGAPRRLTVHVADVADHQPDAEEEMLGPPTRAAFDAQGAPTKAALGFAKSQGVAVEAIFRKQTPRGEYCAVLKQHQGRPAGEVLAEILPKIAASLSFPKSMVWQADRRSFARPVRWLLALLGEQVVPFTLFEVASGRTTEGHPILSPGCIEIADAGLAAYKEALRGRFVIVDHAERRALIEQGIRAAESGLGAVPREADHIVDEIVNLTQYPTVMKGRFDAHFLDVPHIAVETAMMEHQRYLPIRKADELCPVFLFVSDRPATHADLIRLGNEQVLKARLSDAQFFDQVDRKTRLEDRVESLRGVAFLKGLGTTYDKCLRLEKLAAVTAAALGMDACAADHAARAARLCKADLLTEMVGEFPVLQGRVGRICALRDGEPEAVAIAIEEHYFPRSAEGDLPASPAGRALSLAEKADNLVGCFALGLLPSGSQDPYALRRQSQAALRLIEESGRHFPLSRLLCAAQALLPKPHCDAAEAIPKLMEFIRDRLFQMALDRGCPHDLIRAALAAGCDDAADFWERLEALRRMAETPVWRGLVAAVERTHNISRAAPEGGAVDASLLSDPAEREVWELFQRHGAEISALLDQRKYADAAARYADVFAAPLHEFFEKVFVNVEDERVKNNRLRLLRDISRLFSARVADLSQILTGVPK